MDTKENIRLEERVLKLEFILNTISWFLVFNYLFLSIIYITLVAKGF